MAYRKITLVLLIFGFCKTVVPTKEPLYYKRKNGKPFTPSSKGPFAQTLAEVIKENKKKTLEKRQKNNVMKTQFSKKNKKK